MLVYSPDHTQANGKDYGGSTTIGVDDADTQARQAGMAGRTVVWVGRLPTAHDGVPIETMETYVPLYYKGDLIPSGVVRIGLPYGPVATAIASEGWDLAAVLAIGLLILYALLYRIVSAASHRLRLELTRNEHLALHDALTGLPNRTLFGDRVEQAIARPHAQRQGSAVLVLDLDHFKEVNDTLGHHAGDLLLCEAAARLRSVLRESDTVARLGGDEFAVLLPTVDGAATARRWSPSEIRAALAVPVPIDGS